MGVLKILTDSIDAICQVDEYLRSLILPKLAPSKTPPILISAFCGSLKLRIFSAYDRAAFGRKNRCRFWCGEQAQHRLGDRKSLVRGGCAPDFQLSRRTGKGKCGGTGRRVRGKDAAVSLRRFQRRRDQ